MSGIRQEARPEGDRRPKDTQRTAITDQAQLYLPERVTVALAELAGAAREGLLALAVGTGLQVLEVMLAEDVARLVGVKGRHIPELAAQQAWQQVATILGRLGVPTAAEVRRASGGPPAGAEC